MWVGVTHVVIKLLVALINDGGVTGILSEGKIDKLDGNDLSELLLGVDFSST